MGKTAIQAEIDKQYAQIEAAKEVKAAYMIDSSAWHRKTKEIDRRDYAILVLQSLLPVERQQIEAAFDAGGDAEYHSVPIAATDYYNQTFNQPTDELSR